MTCERGSCDTCTAAQGRAPLRMTVSLSRVENPRLSWTTDRWAQGTRSGLKAVRHSGSLQRLTLRHSRALQVREGHKGHADQACQCSSHARRSWTPLHRRRRRCRGDL